MQRIRTNTNWQLTAFALSAMHWTLTLPAVTPSVLAQETPAGHPPDAAQPESLVDYARIDPVALAGEPKLLKSGFTFTEGPLWIASQQALLFSDVREEVTWRFRAPAQFDRYIESNGGGNGLAITPQGALIMCQVEARTLGRLQLPSDYGQQPPQLEILADAYDGSSDGLKSGKFNQTNDAIVRSDGTIYFTDPAYRPHPRDLEHTGVYRVTPAGEVKLVTRDYYPNGIALSPDERWLYIVNRRAIERLELRPDGSASNARTLLTTTSDGDGMAVDDVGNLYVATNQIEVFSPEGKSFGTIKLPGAGLTNLSFGGPDRKTLFATTADSLTSVSMPIPGLP